MSRWVALCMLTLAACGGPAERDGTVARVDDWILDDDQLADLLVLAQPFPLEPEPAAELVEHWIGVAALARRVAAADSLTSEDAVRESTWLERREALLLADRERRLADSLTEPTEEDFRRGPYRLVAHVLRRVGPETSEEERELQRRSAQRILEELVGGASWDAVAARSEDPATADASGLLGLVARGDLPAPLDRVAFQLEPGQVSAVVESSAGFHILYRPRWEEVADLFVRRLGERRLAEVDAVSAEELGRERGVRAAEGAIPRLREIASRPLGWLESGETLASWRGGSLSAATVARYVVALPRASRREMTEAADADLASFLEDVAVRDIRVREASAADPAQVRALAARLRRQHVEEVGHWLATLGIADGRPVTREVVDRYMERVVSRQVPQRALPPLFRAWLLRRTDRALVPAGISDALAGARSMLGGRTPGGPPGSDR